MLLLECKWCRRQCFFCLISSSIWTNKQQQHKLCIKCKYSFFVTDLWMECMANLVEVKHRIILFRYEVYVALLLCGCACVVILWLVHFFLLLLYKLKIICMSRCNVHGESERPNLQYLFWIVFACTLRVCWCALFFSFFSLSLSCTSVNNCIRSTFLQRFVRGSNQI